MINLILQADADGTLHLPLPAELRHGKVEVTATLRAANEGASSPPRATVEMLRRRQEAFEALRLLNPFREVDDPVAWQRKIRKDRPLPGRD